MDEIDFSDSKFNHLRCTYNPKDNHIYKDPIKLPCNNTFCKECVKTFISDKKKCKCDSLHEDLNIDSIDVDKIKVNEINENSTLITEEIINKLLSFAESMKGNCNNNVSSFF